MTFAEGFALGFYGTLGWAAAQVAIVLSVVAAVIVGVFIWAFIWSWRDMQKRRRKS